MLIGLVALRTKKSTYGGCFYLGNNLVSWMSKKQNNISLSTVEAEYIAAALNLFGCNRCYLIMV